MRDHFPPNFWLMAANAASVIVIPVWFTLMSWPHLGRACCPAIAVCLMLGFIMLTTRGLYLSETHLIQYWMRPEYVVKRIRLTRIVDLNRTVRATYITAASGRVLIISRLFVRYYYDLLPSLQARVGPHVPVTDTQAPA